MSYFYYFLYIGISLLALFMTTRYKKLTNKLLIIGVVTIAYSLIYDNFFGTWLGLYHYLDSVNSTIYIIISSIAIYPIYNIIYVMFLPHKPISFFIYTFIWIGVMLAYEYLTVYQRIIVLTGWQPIPWSILTYIFTYIWINTLRIYLCKETNPSSFT